uniref:Uncharacterized protein n=1 Tax=Panagrolaimus davidi TaxID=227884 RepID=A0A914R5D8_9BILA
MDIKKYKNATQARQPFVRQCCSVYSPQHVLDDIERYTITQCSLLSKDIIQSFVAAQKKLHYYEKKFGFSFENNSTLLEFKTGEKKTFLALL